MSESSYSYFTDDEDLRLQLIAAEQPVHGFEDTESPKKSGCACSFDHLQTGVVSISSAAPYFKAHSKLPLILSTPVFEQTYQIRLSQIPHRNSFTYYPVLFLDRRPIPGEKRCGNSHNFINIAGILNQGDEAEFVHFLLSTGHSVSGEMRMMCMHDDGEEVCKRREVPVFVWESKYDRFRSPIHHWLNALLDDMDDSDAGVWSRDEGYGHELWEGQGAAEIEDLRIGRSKSDSFRVWEDDVHGLAPWGEEIIEEEVEVQICGDLEL